MADRVTLGVDLKGVRLPTPVLGASGCFGSGQEMSPLVSMKRVGGIITKSVTLRPTKGFPPPRMVETASGMLNAIGLQNPGIVEFIRKDGPFIGSVGVPVILSIAGKSVDEFADLSVRAREIPGVVAIEANLSSPNARAIGARVFARDPLAAAEVVAAVVRMTSLPVFAKLTADVTDIVEVAQECMRAGAHGLSLINTLMAMAVDVDTFAPSLAAVTGGLSGPAIKPVALRAVWQVAQALPEAPIIGMGGIRDARDAIEFLLAGAWAVAVGTANFFDPQATTQVAEGIREFLRERGLRGPDDLRGRLRAGTDVEEPAFRGG